MQIGKEIWAHDVPPLDMFSKSERALKAGAVSDKHVFQGQALKLNI